MKARVRSLPVVGLVAAESLSLLGNQVAAVAIPVLVLKYTHSPITAGIAAIGNILPIFLAALLGGRAIDKFGAWKISVVADLLSFVSVLALPLAFMHGGSVPPFAIFLLVFIGALFDPTGISARQTLVPELAERSGKPLRTINSWRGSLENGADFLGPVIGVGLIGIAGVANTFFINALTFLLCAAVFAITVPRKHRTAPPSGDGVALRGVQFIFRHPHLRSLAIAGMVANAVILPFLALLLPVLTTQKFANTTLLGVCLSVFGLAATLGAASYSYLARRFSRTAIFYGGLLLTGSAMILCALATAWPEVIASVALAGVLLGAGNPLQQTMLHEETPTPIAGQVFTSLTALGYAAGPVGLLLAGMIAEYTDVETALWWAGGLLASVAVFGGRFMPLHGQPHDAERA